MTYDDATYSSQYLCLLRLTFRNKLHGLHSRGTTTDDDHILVFDILSVQLRGVEDLTLELFLPRYVWHLRITAGSNGSNDTVVLGTGAIVDEPAILGVFAYRRDSIVELRLVL